VHKIKHKRSNQKILVSDLRPVFQKNEKLLKMAVFRVGKLNGFI
jgi:hypothetical protein